VADKAKWLWDQGSGYGLAKEGDDVAKWLLM
jgi:hypothetical protein